MTYDGNFCSIILGLFPILPSQGCHVWLLPGFGRWLSPLFDLRRSSQEGRWVLLRAEAPMRNSVEQVFISALWGHSLKLL